MLGRFTNEIKIGDYVVCPSKVDRTLNFGRNGSDFLREIPVDVHPEGSTHWVPLSEGTTWSGNGVRWRCSNAVTY